MNNRKIAFPTLVLALVAGSVSAQTAAPSVSAQSAPSIKLGVFDFQRLVVASAAGKEARARVEKIVSGKQAEREKLQKELQDLQQKLSDQGPSMTDEKKDNLNKEYQEKGIAFKRFEDDMQRELQEAQQKELVEIEKRLLPIINQVGKEKGYTVIFNKSVNEQLPVFVYIDDTIDITDEVLRRFNTQVTAPAPKPPAGAKPAKPEAAPPKKPGSN